METREKATMTAAPKPDAKIQQNFKKSKMAADFDLKEECQRLLDSQEPQDVGVFRVRTANATIKEAANRPNPTPLWLELWYKGEISCLFSDSNLGKSIYAVQIGVDIARRGIRVLYFDFELSDKQFQMRYTDKTTSALFRFPPTFFRVEVNREKISADFEEIVMKDIEQTALETGATVLIVDNITWLSSESEKGGDAATLMKQLMTLKFKYDWSLLVIAHTPKRQLTNALTQNDLGGSKKLFNFFDGVFAIGQSAKDPTLRYIKQVKCRYGSFRYDRENVIVYSIEQIDSFTQFVFQGFATEREHLKEPSDKDINDRVAKAKELAAQGWTQRQIAAELGLSVGCVNKYLKK